MKAQFDLPDSAYVNKFVAKSKFYDRVTLSTKLQNEFIKKIQRITWKYKLSEETIGIPKTDRVEEIQIFEVELKEHKIPANVLKVIDKTIPYQILYIFTYKENIAYGITLKEDHKAQNYYFSDWNEELIFDFTGISLEKVYQKLIKAFLPEELLKKDDFDKIISIDNKIRMLEKEITTLTNKIEKEKQFNRKVELNKSLISKKKKLKELRGNL